MGTSPCSWQIEAYLARACAFVEMLASLGIFCPILITALHLANLAPIEKYPAHLSLSPSRPSVIFSPGWLARSLAPVSTLMPGYMPLLERYSGIGVPSSMDCLIVSSNRMTPLIADSYPSVENMLDLYILLASGDGSIPTASSLLDIVPLLSSAARMPFPDATSSLAVFSRSCLSISATNYIE